MKTKLVYIFLAAVSMSLSMTPTFALASNPTTDSATVHKCEIPKGWVDCGAGMSPAYDHGCKVDCGSGKAVCRGPMGWITSDPGQGFPGECSLDPSQCYCE